MCILGQGCSARKITEDGPQKKSFSSKNFSSYLLNAHKELGLLFVCLFVLKLETTLVPHSEFVCHVSVWSIFLQLSYKPVN